MVLTNFPQIGSTVLDRYVVKEGPFHGNYGRVYIVEDTQLGRKSAIKVPYPFVALDSIISEAKNQATVDSQYVVRIWDLKKTDNQLLLIVMEYCPFSLQKLLRDALKKQGNLGYDIAKQILNGCLEGIAAAHEKDIVHGDIKPANILFTSLDEPLTPKLADFGAARYLREEQSYFVKGSSAWMAPEVLKGNPTSKYSDYFSLGALAYLLLTLRHPFFCTDPSCLFTEDDNIIDPNFVVTPLKDLRPDVPDKIAQSVMGLLSQDEEVRCMSMEGLRMALSEPPELDPVMCENNHPNNPLNKFCPQCGAQLVSQQQEEKAREVASGYEEAKKLFFGMGDTEGALDKLNKLLMKFGKQVIPLIADCWSLLAFIHNRSGNYLEAKDAATKGIAIDSKHANSYHVRGFALFRLHDHKGAKRDLEKALRYTQDIKKQRQINQLLRVLES